MMTRACRETKTGFYMVIPDPSQSATNLYLVRFISSTNSPFGEALEAVSVHNCIEGLGIKFL